MATQSSQTSSLGEAQEVNLEHLARFSKKTVLTASKVSLPARFYYEPEIYELERRAIFSKRWFLVSHEARYRNVGDFVQYDMAGFNIIVLKNRAGRISGFHNICRYI
jgi:hypothetical protein